MSNEVDIAGARAGAAERVARGFAGIDADVAAFKAECMTELRADGMTDEQIENHMRYAFELFGF